MAKCLHRSRGMMRGSCCAQCDDRSIDAAQRARGCVSETDGRALQDAMDVGRRGAVSPDSSMFTWPRKTAMRAIFARDTTTGALVQLNGLAGCSHRMGMRDCAPQRPEKSIHVSEPGWAARLCASRYSDAVAIFARNVTTGRWSS